jgi:hypothetical protein
MLYHIIRYFCPVRCMCGSQPAQRRERNPSNRPVQSGYIEILRLP